MTVFNIFCWCFPWEKVSPSLLSTRNVGHFVLFLLFILPLSDCNFIRRILGIWFCSCWQGRSQPHSPRWARVPLSSFSPPNFDHFFLFFLKLFSFSSSFWLSGWAREGPDHATACWFFCPWYTVISITCSALFACFCFHLFCSHIKLVYLSLFFLTAICLCGDVCYSVYMVCIFCYFLLSLLTWLMFLLILKTYKLNVKEE